jgi:urease accessory protein
VKNFKVATPIATSLIALPALAMTLAARPALAHHPMGGMTPSTVADGLLSGLAHPVIGPEHFAFIVAVGLLAAAKRQGWVIPAGFVAMTAVGTGLHLLQLPMPGVELLVAASILMVGFLLMQTDWLNLSLLASLAGLAGLFHGYAYGEAIFGAESTPLVAYLIGFTAIQTAIALGSWWIGKSALLDGKLRSAGLVICGIGAAFVASQLSRMIFPG